jgi:hypothetical protein
MIWENSGGASGKETTGKKLISYWTKVQYTRMAVSVYLYTTKSVDALTLFEA